jgi:hypothetical protein
VITPATGGILAALLTSYGSAGLWGLSRRLSTRQRLRDGAPAAAALRATAVKLALSRLPGEWSAVVVQFLGPG